MIRLFKVSECWVSKRDVWINRSLGRPMLRWWCSEQAAIPKPGQAHDILFFPPRLLSVNRSTLICVPRVHFKLHYQSIFIICTVKWGWLYKVVTRARLVVLKQIKLKMLMALFVLWCSKCESPHYFLLNFCFNSSKLAVFNFHRPWFSHSLAW